MMFHLIINSHRMGAAALLATYRDESYNGVIRGIARSCHRSTFGYTVHMKTAMLQALGGLSAMFRH